MSSPLEDLNKLKSQSDAITEIVNQFQLDLEPRGKPSSIDLSSPENNMATTLSLTIDPLKYLSGLPEFSGEYQDLQNFLDLIDKIHPLLIKYDALSQSIFSDKIKAKLKGRAREVVEINNHVTTWNEIKTILINNFGDRRTLEELFDELRGATFINNSVEFYNQIKSTLRRLNNKTKQIFDANSASSEVNISQNIQSALHIFKAKLPEPMRSLLYCRNPKTLEEAINIMHKAGYAYFMQSDRTKENNKTFHSSSGYNNRVNYRNDINFNTKREQTQRNPQSRNQNFVSKTPSAGNSNSGNFNNNRYSNLKYPNNRYFNYRNPNPSNFYPQNPNTGYSNPGHTPFNNNYQNNNHNQIPNPYNNNPNVNTKVQKPYQNSQQSSNINNQIEPMDVNHQCAIDIGNFPEPAPTNYAT